MAKSMRENLDQDMSCEGLLECIHGLKDLDIEIFNVLAGGEEPLTVDEIADEVERERSTAYRSVQRLHKAGYVQKEQINYDEGGYYHIFHTADAHVIAENMQQMLDEWYGKMEQLIREFRGEYGQETGQTPSIEP